MRSSCRSAAVLGIAWAQPSGSQLNWWDGLVESWGNLPTWVQAAVVAGGLALLIALVASVGLWANATFAIRRQRQSVPASIRSGWLAMPTWSKVVHFSLVGVVALVGFSALTGRPAADLRVSPSDVAFGGVVNGGTATSELTLTNQGTAGSRSIKIEGVTLTGADADLFSVVAGADAVVPTGGDGVITIAFSPDSTGLKTARLEVVHSGANSPLTVAVSGLGATVIRMNAGGIEIADSPVWAQDRVYIDTARTTAVDDGGLQIDLSHPSVPANTPSNLFQSARISEAFSLDYAFPAEPGRYEVRLFFAELSGAGGSPLLNVTVNGHSAVEQLDVGELVGSGEGLMVPIVVDSTGDSISVEVASLVGSPWINGIEIIDISQSSGSQLDVPAFVDLGPVQAMATASQDLALRNVGDRLIDPTVVIESIRWEPADEFALDGLGATAIGHGREDAGSLELTPTSIGTHEATLRVDHSGAASPQMISVTGFGWLATDDVANTPEDEAVVIAVLANDGDTEGSVLTVFDVDRPSNGVAETDGRTVTFQPNLNFNGVVTFGYRVRDSNGAVAQASISVVVADVNDPPVASANGPYSGSTGVRVVFSSAGSSDPDGVVSRFSWTFGDGATSSAANPSHTYSDPGTYSVELRVTDNDGASATSSTSVSIDPRLSVSKTGDGAGTVSSAPAGISCGTDCSQTYAPGTSVTLSATPAAGSVFVGWSGACTGSGGCAIGMNGDRTASAEFRRLFDLTVSKVGSGTVTSTPAGINCGTNCAKTLVSGDTITLSASAAAGWIFTGWSGGGCSGTGPCTVSMTQTRSVTATFSADQTLTVSVAGSGSGSVTGPGINCGSDCSQSYTYNTQVTLSASASTGSTFTGWSGVPGCSGTGSCTVSMTQARNVTASFAINSYQLSVSKSGSGRGRVTSSPSGINCGPSCSSDSATFTYGTQVTLSASASGGSTFTGWSGEGCSGTGTCTMSMTESRSVTATFQPNQTLSVSVTGSGSVTGPGISCPGDCFQSYSFGTPVTLTRAAPLPGWTFSWGGDCGGSGSTCQVTMTANHSVTATYTQPPVPPPP